MAMGLYNDFTCQSNRMDEVQAFFEGAFRGQNEGGFALADEFRISALAAQYIIQIQRNLVVSCAVHILEGMPLIKSIFSDYKVKFL